MATRDAHVWGQVAVEPGEGRHVSFNAGQMYSGAELHVQAHVWRGERDGPAVFITAAVHGDELNGTGAIRHLLIDEPFRLVAGTLVLVPVVNLPGFERHSRYLPDRRDLNRCFPGSADGSLASRLAHAVFQAIVLRCDMGIDLHTAASRRTNFPNVRADMGDERVAELARSFGGEVIVPGSGPRGSLRRAACRAGCPTIILEAGETWRVQPAVVDAAVTGIRNVLVSLGMVEGDPEPPPVALVAQSMRWIRAEAGGFLRFHVAPGDVVPAGAPLATSSDLVGRPQHTLHAPRGGMVLGMTTLPSVAPGDPVCHLAFLDDAEIDAIRETLAALPEESVHRRVRDELGAGMVVEEPTPFAP